MKVRTCHVCGISENDTKVYGGINNDLQTLCRKHYLQIKRHGRVLNRTIYDSNEIELVDDHAIIRLYTKTNEFKGVTLISVDDVDRCKSIKWYLRPNGYVFGSQGGGKIKLHDFIYGDKPSGMIIDHIDGNPLNNRRDNLRIATTQQNAWNQKNKNKIVGVNYTKYNGGYKWIPTLMINGKTLWLGSYDDEDSAIRKRLEAERDNLGEFAPHRHLFEKYGIESVPLN